MSKIRYRGHDIKNKVGKDKNEVYKRITELLTTEELFTDLGNDNLLKEFDYEWKFHIRKELSKHISYASCWVGDINPSNMLKVYPTNLCDGKIFIRSIILPVVEKFDETKKEYKLSRFDHQLNLEIGIYTDDGYKSFVLERVYEVES